MKREETGKMHARGTGILRNLHDFYGWDYRGSHHPSTRGRMTARGCERTSAWATHACRSLVHSPPSRRETWHASQTCRCKNYNEEVSGSIDGSGSNQAEPAIGQDLRVYTPKERISREHAEASWWSTGVLAPGTGGLAGSVVTDAVEIVGSLCRVSLDRTFCPSPVCIENVGARGLQIPGTEQFRTAHQSEYGTVGAANSWICQSRWRMLYPSHWEQRRWTCYG
jgi:hypothetical protein